MLTVILGFILKVIGSAIIVAALFTSIVVLIGFLAAAVMLGIHLAASDAVIDGFKWIKSKLKIK